MWIYLVKRIKLPDYDRHYGFVIVAKDDVSARRLAIREESTNAGDPRGEVWNDSTQTTCTIVGKPIDTTRKECIILSSFRAG